MGGALLAMKGSAASEELNEAQGAITKLGGKIGQEVPVNLPNGDPRTIIIIDKVSATPNRYPRKPGDPARKPL